MSILSGFKKYKNYKTDSNGDHQLQSYWTSSDSVDGNITEASTRTNLANGETLTTSLGKIKKFFSDLGSSAFKNTTNTYDPSGTDPVTGQAVAQAIEGLPEPMIYKGTLGTGGTITTLPTASSANEGFTYKVITAGTYASQAAKVGDTFTSARPEGAQSYEWVLFPSGDEPSGTVTNVATGTGLTGGPVTTSGTISHADTSSQPSVTNSGRTYIQSVTLDGMGHVTALSSATETVTNTDRYVNSAAFAHDSTNDNVKMTLTRAGSDTATVTGNIPKVSSSSAGVAPKGASVSSQSQSTKFLREDGSWSAPSYTVNTDTTYTFAGGTNKFTVTPKGGTAQDVAVTPSIANNVTGSGTNGYIAKFNGANTITNGPAFGSDTSKFLRNDGSWATVTSGVSGVKGNAESTYRTGNVNLTPANIGALASNGTAVKATADADGNTISSTYMKKGTDYVTAGKKSGTTLGEYATAEGYKTTASGDCSHAEGYQTTITASGHYSHAEGSNTIASGSCSHAEGVETEATASAAHAEGYETIAGSEYQHVEGKYNVEDTSDTYAHIIGGGTGSSSRKNIFTVDWNGNVNDGTGNRLAPFKVVTEAQYSALSSAEKNNGTIYFRTGATVPMRPIQDDGSATDLTSGNLPTGQTIKSYLNSKLDWKDLYNGYIVPASTAATYTPIVSLASVKEVMVALWYSKQSVRQTIVFPISALTSNYTVADFYYAGARLYCSLRGSTGSISLDGGNAGSVVWGSGSGQCTIRLYYR